MLDVAVEEALKDLHCRDIHQKEAALAFDALAKAVGARNGSSEFRDDHQAALARVIYDYWQAQELSYNCRTLLSLALPSFEAAASTRTPFLSSLLQNLNNGFSNGNKRALQILAIAFDAIPRGMLEEHFPSLWKQLVASLHEHSGSVQAAKIMVKLGRGMPDLQDRMVALLLLDTPHARQAVFEIILPGLLSERSDLLLNLSTALSVHGEQKSASHSLAYLSLLRAGATAGVMGFPPLAAVETHISECLTDSDPSVRFEALRLLCALPIGAKPSQPLPDSHLRLHALFWQYNLADSDSASVRTGLVGVWKDFIGRCRTSSSAAARESAKANRAVEQRSGSLSIAGREAQEYVEAVQTFFTDWVDQAIENLKEYKPYRCQMNALRFLEILLGEGVDPHYSLNAVLNVKGKGKASIESANWPFAISIVNQPTFTSRTLACITSTYEDIKTTAWQLLSRWRLPESPLSQVQQYAYRLIGQQRDADIASGILLLRLTLAQYSRCSEESYNGTNPTLVALQSLLDMLNERFSVIGTDFETKAEDVPLHGFVSALTSVLDLDRLLMAADLVAP